MVSIVDGHIDLKVLEVKDIIEVNTLQKFLDNFAIGMDCAAVSVGRNGEEITKPSYYRPFCENFIHSCSIGDKRCAKCHNEMGQKSVQSGKPFIGRCHAGLIDFSAPIMVDGEHIGTVLGGQVLDNSPDEGYIRKVAGELQLNADELWAAAKKIDIVPGKKIQAAAEVLFVVVNSLAQSGYNRLEIEILTKNLVDNFIQISQTIEMLSESAQNITVSQHNLSDRIQDVKRKTLEIRDVLGEISNVSYKTKLVGMNALIEAAHLGESGKSFTVVAEEIHTLSEQSQNIVAKINDLNQLIQTSIQNTTIDAKGTLDDVETQSAAMEELTTTLQNSLSLAESLKTIFLDKKN